MVTSRFKSRAKKDVPGQNACLKAAEMVTSVFEIRARKRMSFDEDICSRAAKDHLECLEYLLKRCTGMNGLTTPKRTKRRPTPTPTPEGIYSLRVHFRTGFILSLLSSVPFIYYITQCLS